MTIPLMMKRMMNNGRKKSPCHFLLIPKSPILCNFLSAFSVFDVFSTVFCSLLFCCTTTSTIFSQTHTTPSYRSEVFSSANINYHLIITITLTANTDNITSAIPYTLFNTICHFCWRMIPFFIFSSSVLKSINTSLSICSISPCIFLRLLPASLAFSNSFLPSVSICHTSCSVLLICFS